MSARPPEQLKLQPHAPLVCLIAAQEMPGSRVCGYGILLFTWWRHARTLRRAARQGTQGRRCIEIRRAHKFCGRARTLGTRRATTCAYTCGLPLLAEVPAQPRAGICHIHMGYGSHGNKGTLVNVQRARDDDSSRSGRKPVKESHRTNLTCNSYNASSSLRYLLCIQVYRQRRASR